LTDAKAGDGEEGFISYGTLRAFVSTASIVTFHLKTIYSFIYLITGRSDFGAFGSLSIVLPTPESSAVFFCGWTLGAIATLQC